MISELQQGGITLSSELLLSLLGAAGVSAVVPMLIQAWIKRREHKDERREEMVDKAEETAEQVETRVLEETARIRQELRQDLKEASERNDALSARYGAVLQEKAQLAGQLAAAEDQNKALISRLTTEGMRVADAEDRAKRDRLAREQAEARYEFLVARHSELERDYARLSRGAATRKSDFAPTADSDRITPGRRASDSEKAEP